MDDVDLNRKQKKTARSRLPAVAQDDLSHRPSARKKFSKRATQVELTGIPSTTTQVMPASQSSIEKFLPSAFRDQDFVFHSKGEGEEGKRMFREALFLAFKWDQFNKDGYLSSDSWDLNKLDKTDPLFKRFPALLEGAVSAEKPAEQEVKKTESTLSSLQQLMTGPMPQRLDQVDIDPVLGFSERKVANVAVRTFFTGPEDTSSDWEKNLIKRVEEAKRFIAIDQMYFQPSQKLMNALIEAANRGVKITIVTTIGGRHNSMGERFFGQRNLVSLHTFWSAVREKEKLDLHTYSQGKNGLHKKVVVVDDYVLAGSSNMGTKSLEYTGDHEMNFEASSPEFADQAMRVIQEDIRKSRRLKKITINVWARVMSQFHHFGSVIWG